VNRTAALDYLTNTYAELAVEANWSESAKLVAYTLAIDQSLRMLSFNESELAAADVLGTEIVPYLALLDYFALLRYSTAFAVRADVSVSGAISASQSQVFNHVRSMLSKAEDRLSGLGLSTVEQVTTGRFNLDFLEPDLVTGGGLG
jgi:hypothetical protein